MKRNQYTEEPVITISRPMNEACRWPSLKDVLERLPTQKAGQLSELLAHDWQHTA